MEAVRDIAIRPQRPLPRRKAMGVDYLRSVLGIDQGAMVKAQDPFNYHAYVYAAAMAIATNLAQVPLEVFQETDVVTESRRNRAQRKGITNWTPRCGKRRMLNVAKRYLRQARRFRGRNIRGLELDADHDINLLLEKPNPIMTGTQLIEAIAIYMSLRGESFLLMVMGDGAPVAPGQTPDELWCINPDNIKEVTDRATGGLLGWRWTPRGEGFTRLGQTTLLPHEVMQFKYFNPGAPLRGMAPLSPAAMSVTQDMLADLHNKSSLENGAEPGGWLEFDGELDPIERELFREEWKDRHEGPQNRRKLAILENGFTFHSSGMSMQDMQYMEQKGWNRESILAVLRVPKSVLSITEGLNYAIQLSQDKNFWNKCLIPLAKHIETVINGVLMWNEPDTVVVAFDLTGVEALQEDIKEKVETATKLSSPDGLRMPPQQSLDLVGLEVDEYLGGNLSLVRPIMVTIETLLEEEDQPDDEPVKEAAIPSPPEETARVETPKKSNGVLVLPSTSDFCKRRGVSSVIMRRKAHGRRKTIVDGWVSTIDEQEKPFKTKYKSHVIGLRAETLRNFDNATKAIVRDLSPKEIDRILFDLEAANLDIKRKTAPLYERMIESTYEFTEDELGGIFVFDIDDPEALKFMQAKVNKITGVNVRLRKALGKTMLDGVRNGETIQELRGRISRAFNRAVSPSRTLTIARTESAQMMSGTRDIIFKQEGVTKHEWITAGDEHVRENHVIFGAAGEKKRGFNFMTLVGGGGKLLHPSYMGGPASEVINCRCVSIATG